MSLTFRCNIQIVGSEFGINNMNPSCLASTVQAAACGLAHIFLDFLVPIKHHLIATAKIGIVINLKQLCDVVICHYEPKSLRNDSSTLMNLCHK